MRLKKKVEVLEEALAKDEEVIGIVITVLQQVCAEMVRLHPELNQEAIRQTIKKASLRDVI